MAAGVPVDWAYPGGSHAPPDSVLGVLVGGNAVIDLRLLGWGQSDSARATRKSCFPVMWIGSG